MSIPPNTPPEKVTIGGRTATLDDIHELFDDKGNLRRTFVKASYIDGVKGGRLASEVKLKNDLKDKGDGSYDVTQTEDGTAITWNFAIEKVSEEQKDQGFTATYKLVNGGTPPPDGDFVIISWAGPDGQKGTGDTFTVTFPKPGAYEVKVSGQTKKYQSNFSITKPVSF